jgi:2,4'-dihydroxyacetophenone dioxygenase
MVKLPEGAPKLEEILIDTGKMPWREKSLKGISEKMLWRNEETGASIALIRFAKAQAFRSRTTIHRTSS